MQRQGLLTTCAVKKSGHRPILDKNKNYLGDEFYFEETGEFTTAITDDLSITQVEAIKTTVAKPTKEGVQKALEYLAQLKPIGSSGIKKATVIGFLVYDLLDEGVSEYVVHELCKEYRRSTESRFFPDGAEFLKKAIHRMNKYKSIQTALVEFLNPQEKPLIEYKKEESKYTKWDDRTEEDKKEQIEYMKTLKPPYLGLYKRAIGIPDEFTGDYDEV